MVIHKRTGAEIRTQVDLLESVNATSVPWCPLFFLNAFSCLCHWQLVDWPGWLLFDKFVPEKSSWYNFHGQDGRKSCDVIDSGRPLICGGQLCGLLKFGSDCGRPEVFVKMGNYVRWIRENTEPVRQLRSVSGFSGSGSDPKFGPKQNWILFIIFSAAILFESKFENFQKKKNDLTLKDEL